MNKLTNGFFERDIVVKVISVLTAVLIWFIVLDQDNPFEERTISVPLTNNVDVLESNNLQIVGTALPMTIDVKIKGRRKRIAAVSPNDFKVMLDLSSVTDSGIKNIKLNSPQYTGDKDVIITGVNPASLNLRFERIIGKQYPVNVEFYGSLPEGYSVVNLKVDPVNVILEEKEGVMARIKKVTAMVNLEDMRTTKELVMRATVYDTSDKPLSQFEGKIPVIVSFDLAKNLPVFAAAKGEPKEGWYFKEIRLDTHAVSVIGTKELLDSLSRINAEPVDISGKSANFTTELSLSLPKGASLLEQESTISAEFVIEPLVSKSFNIPASMISIYESDTTGAKQYSLSEDSFSIAVEGRPEIIQGLKLSDIRCGISVNSLDIGEHVVPVTVGLPSGVTLKEQVKVNVIITGNETVEPQNTANPPNEI